MDIEDEVNDLLDDGSEAEELLEAAFQVSPLTTLDSEKVDLLTAKQRAFLLGYISTGSAAQARRLANISRAGWEKWQKDERFMELYGQVRNPVGFANQLAQAIVFRAALEHFKLLGHEKVSVRQWAIEHAYGLTKLLNKEDNPDDPGRQLTHDDVKQLAAGIVAELPEAARDRIERGPFEIIEATYTEVPSDRRSERMGDGNSGRAEQDKAE